MQNPKVFISYSWDNETHKEWVLNLANQLVSNGVDVFLDRYELTAGRNIQYFIDNAIIQAERLIIVFTPNYKLKAENRNGGVGYEFSIINNELYKNIKHQQKVIPILRSGTLNSSMPNFIQQFIHIDFSNDMVFKNRYVELLREIYKEPIIKKPELGKKPNFQNGLIGYVVKSPYVAGSISKLSIFSKFLDFYGKISNRILIILLVAAVGFVVWYNIRWQSNYDAVYNMDGQKFSIITKNNRDGYANSKTGNILINPKYTMANFFSEGLAEVRDDNFLWGFVDTTGNEVIPCRYVETNSFSGGIAPVKKSVNSRLLWGFVDRTGKEIIPCRFETFPKRSSDGLILVTLNQKQFYLDDKGKLVRPAK